MGRLHARHHDLVIDPEVSADMRHYVRKTQLRIWIAAGSTILLLGAIATLLNFWAVSRTANMLLIDLVALMALVYSGVLHMKILRPMRKRKQLLDTRRAFWLESDGLISSFYHSQAEEINRRGGERKGRLHILLFLEIATITHQQAIIDSMGNLADEQIVQAERDVIEAIISRTTETIENYLSPE